MGVSPDTPGFHKVANGAETDCIEEAYRGKGAVRTEDNVHKAVEGKDTSAVKVAALFVESMRRRKSILALAVKEQVAALAYRNGREARSKVLDKEHTCVAHKAVRTGKTLVLDLMLLPANW